MAHQRPFKEILEFHARTIGLSDEEKKEKAREIGLDFGEFTRRIGGKKKEAEFLLYLISLKVANVIEEIDESESANKGEYTPDFYIEFRDGYKMYLEIKHTDDSEKKISGGNLKKRINFATDKGLPLRFAFSIRGVWILLTSEQLEKNNGKVEIGNMLDSWLDIELGTCSYQFIQPLKIVSKFSRKTGFGLGVYEEPYGELISHKLYNNDNLIFEVNPDDKKHLPLMLFLEALHDFLSNMERWVVSSSDETIITNKSTKTIVDFKATKAYEQQEESFITVQEYKFFLSAIQHASALIGENRDDNIFIATQKKLDEYPLLTAEHIRYAMLYLNELGVPVYCLRQKHVYAIADFREQFWTRREDEIK